MTFPAFKAGDAFLRGTGGGFDFHTPPPEFCEWVLVKRGCALSAGGSKRQRRARKLAQSERAGSPHIKLPASAGGATPLFRPA